MIGVQTAFAVFEVDHGLNIPQGLVINLVSGKLESMDIYGEGPASAGDGYEDGDDGAGSTGEATVLGDVKNRAAPLPPQFCADRLVGACAIEQRFSQDSHP